MSLKVIHKEDIASFVTRALSEYALFGPVARETQFAFAPIGDAAQLRLDYNTSILPPKKYLSPQQETLFAFRTDMLSTTPSLDMQWRVLFGVHTCDLHAINLLDAVFRVANADAHYLKRRATTLIVSLECLQPCDEHSFCKSMNTLSASRGFDLHMIDLGDEYAVEVGTPAGDALLTNHAKTREMTRDEMRLLNKAVTAKWERFPRKLAVEARELPALMALSQHSPMWDELGKRCLSCSACNLVCPTCYCFDVREHLALDGKSGERYRVWDSCQLDQFATVATGENFRKTRAQRLRHRFFRKGKYIADAFPGEWGCVGCGRCARNCLVNISPVKVWNDLAKAHAV